MNPQGQRPVNRGNAPKAKPAKPAKAPKQKQPKQKDGKMSGGVIAYIVVSILLIMGLGAAVVWGYLHYSNKVDEAIRDISAFGDFEAFVSDQPNYIDITSDELPF